MDIINNLIVESKNMNTKLLKLVKEEISLIPKQILKILNFRKT